MSKQKQEFLNRVKVAAETAWDNTGKDEFVDENFFKALQKDGLVPPKSFVKNKKLKHEPGTIGYKTENRTSTPDKQDKKIEKIIELISNNDTSGLKTYLEQYKGSYSVLYTLKSLKFENIHTIKQRIDLIISLLEDE